MVKQKSFTHKDIERLVSKHSNDAAFRLDESFLDNQGSDPHTQRTVSLDIPSPETNEIYRFIIDDSFGGALGRHTYGLVSEDGKVSLQVRLDLPSSRSFFDIRTLESVTVAYLTLKRRFDRAGVSYSPDKLFESIILRSAEYLQQD